MRELLGRLTGWTWAPAIALVAALKRARFFHPEGVVYLARVDPLSDDPLARAMKGNALARLSTALWRRGREWPDVLGVALRFRGAREASEKPSAGDQDLLFATTRTPWRLGIAPFLTRTHDFFDNTYYAVSPFDAGALGRGYWRITPTPSRPRRGTRLERLERAVADGEAVFTLEWSSDNRRFSPFARITLERRVDVDQAALRMSPFRNGLGVVPRGYVHALRHGAYAASQMARPRRRAR